MKQIKKLIIPCLLLIVLLIFIYNLTYFTNRQTNQQVKTPNLISTKFIFQKNTKKVPPLISLKSYYHFTKKYNQYESPISNSKLQESINPDTLPTPELLPVSQKELGQIILNKLNINFLVKQKKTTIIVTLTETKNYQTHTEQSLIFTSQEVGSFHALILIPKKEKTSYPAIIGLHGHGSDSNEFKNQYLGEELVAQGFIIIIPDFKAMGLTEKEQKISIHLLRQGFNLMGIRIYEALITLQYLLSLDIVNNDKIGALGHSGGSTILRLLQIITTNQIKVSVFDLYSNFINISDNKLHCETIPSIYQYQRNINALKQNQLKVSYDFDNSKKQIINFFDKHLL